MKYFTGQDVASNRTATEVSALVRGGHQKFSYFIGHIENTSIEPFLRMSFENARQFMVKPETLRVMQPDGSLEFLKILPELIQSCECTFRIEGSRGGILKEQEIGALIDFLKVVGSDPQLREQVNVLELYKKIYRRLGFKDEATIFKA